MQESVSPPALLIVLSVVLFYLPLILYLRTLGQVLRFVDARNRTMSPGLVWLNLIPVFSLGWHFYTVFSLRSSLEAEFKYQGVSDPGGAAFKVGLATSILTVCTMIPYLGVLCMVASLVCWIIYWVKMAGYRRRLLELGGA